LSSHSHVIGTAGWSSRPVHPTFGSSGTIFRFTGLSVEKEVIFCGCFSQEGLVICDAYFVFVEQAVEKDPTPSPLKPVVAIEATACKLSRCARKRCENCDQVDCYGREENISHLLQLISFMSVHPATVLRRYSLTLSLPLAAPSPVFRTLTNPITFDLRSE
jgi:hypothetical protein